MLFFYALINMLNLICIEGSFACFCYDVNISDVFYFIFEKKVNICTAVIIHCLLVCCGSADILQKNACEKNFEKHLESPSHFCIFASGKHFYSLFILYHGNTKIRMGNCTHRVGRVLQ